MIEPEACAAARADADHVVELSDGGLSDLALRPRFAHQNRAWVRHKCAPVTRFAF